MATEGMDWMVWSVRVHLVLRKAAASRQNRGFVGARPHWMMSVPKFAGCLEDFDVGAAV
jgi:hypothetical protein